MNYEVVEVGIATQAAREALDRGESLEGVVQAALQAYKETLIETKRTARVGKLKEAVWANGHEDEPYEIHARKDGIELHVGPDFQIVKLRPRHIVAITTMRNDWWEKWWRQTFREEST